MDYSLCSYAVNRTVAAGKMDIFDYIEWNKKAGFTLLDPWMKHIEQGYSDNAYLDRVKAAAAKVGLPFGCVAVDGAHIYEADLAKRAANRAIAYRWIDICQYLGARQVRIDCGGPGDMPDDVFAIIVEGYQDVLDYAAKRGVEVIMENHWGASHHPDNVVKIMETLPGLGLLFDSYNWAPGKQMEGWDKCAKYARCLHIKTFAFDANGNETTQDVHKCLTMLRNLNYQGPWGIESTPNDGDEIAGAEKTLTLMKRILEA